MSATTTTDDPKLPDIPEELRWLEQKVAGYRERILAIPFFDALRGMREEEDFAWARNLLHHSTEFPRVLEIRRDRNDEDGHSAFFEEHVEAERGHAEMLTGWLHDHGLVPSGEPALAPEPTPATVACIAQSYRVAVSGSNEANIVGLNVALEAASFDFFSTVSPQLDDIGIGHEYWRVHVELDEFHSADGLALLPPTDEGTEAGAELDRVARETLMFWGFMLNSWVGVDEWPTL